MQNVETQIKELIKAKGLQHRDIAQRAGFTSQQFSDMLNGRKVIKAEYLPSIAKALDIPVSALFDDAPCYLSSGYSKLTVLDKKDGKEIAVVTNNLITTAGDNIVVKLTPRYD